MKAKRRIRFVAPVVAVALVILVVWLPRRHVQLYRVTVLPTLGGGKTEPIAINDHGQIVGITEYIAGRVHLFLWDRENGMRDLGPAFRHNPVFRHSPDINNAGQIAGTMRDPNGIMQAFLWDAESGKQMLGTIGYAWNAASKLNNRGQVVGTLYHGRSKVRARRQAFIWDKANGMRELFPSERLESIALAINDAGQVMGSTGTFQSPSHHAPCFWDSTDADAEPTPPLQSVLDYPGGSDLNNGGYVVGRMYHWDKTQDWTFLWRKETGVEGIKYLFPLEHSLGPLRINDANQVLYGEKCVSSLQRFSKKFFPTYTQRCLWDPKCGQIVLDKQVPRELGKLLHVRDINSRGCIIGIIRTQGLGQELAVLLEPIPERWVK